MLETINKIFEALSKIEKLFVEKDPLGNAWDLRINTVYRIFRAFDVHRFRLEPADPEKVLADLSALISFVGNVPAVNTVGENFTRFESAKTSAEEKSKRMQYLYGLAFAQLTPEQYSDAADLLRRRIRNSNLDLSFLQGAECLDIGVGTGRYALSMVQLGAKKVIGIDYSRECLAEAEKTLSGLKEYGKISLLYHDLYNLPPEMDERFDFVCTNGVIHHLPDPAGGVQATARCVKKGGHAFIFVFSKNDAPWWESIELMRRLAEPVPIDYAHHILSSYEAPGTKIFNTLDYSYTPIQHKLDKNHFEDILRAAGFREIKLLEGGVIHDSVLRCKLFEADKHLFGITEIRYLLKK